MEQQSASQRAFLKEAVKRYAKSLPDSPADEYLDRRGLNRTQRFMLGFVDEPLPGHEQFNGFLAIPYLRYPYGQEPIAVSIRFRCIQDHEHIGHGKYMTTAGDRPRLFNTRALMVPSHTVAVTEGELDAVTADEAGIPTVGVPGAQAWQAHFREPFLGYRTVSVIADGDEAGMQFAHHVAKSLPNARVIACPPGEDVNSLVLSEGPDAFLRRLE